MYQDSVRTSQETYYVSATKPKWLMLFRETVALCCENHAEHTHNIYELNPYLTGNTYFSATKPNRLILFRETVAVYYENHMEYLNTLCTQNSEF
jgi:hypothetical protein